MSHLPFSNLTESQHAESSANSVFQSRIDHLLGITRRRWADFNQVCLRYLSLNPFLISPPKSYQLSQRTDPLPYVHQTSYSRVRLHQGGEPSDSGFNPLLAAPSTIMGKPSAGPSNHVTAILNRTRQQSTAPKSALSHPPSGFLADHHLAAIQP